MKTKTIFLILGLLVIIGVSIALAVKANAQQGRGIEIGVRYTQEQVDNFNFETVNFHMEYESDRAREINVPDYDPDGRGYDTRVEYPLMMDSLEKKTDEKTNETYYLGVRKERWEYYLGYGERESCEARRNAQDCKKEIERKFSKFYADEREEQVGYLKSLQTPEPPGRNWRDIEP